MSKIIITGIFSHYQPIEFEPYYVFTSNKSFLVKCRDYPDLISNIAPEDLINIEADIGEDTHLGTTLINVKFGGINE